MSSILTNDKVKSWANDHIAAIRAVTIVLAVIIVIAAIVSGSGGKEEESGKSQDLSISETRAEGYCQDAGLLKKYINLDDYAVIKITNYNKQFGSFGGWYDSDGHDILYMRWNGENKITNQIAGFDCWISGENDDNIQLHKLSIEGVVVYDTTQLTVVDEDGNRIFEEDE